jgi:hypothetical protein
MAIRHPGRASFLLALCITGAIFVVGFGNLALAQSPELAALAYDRSREMTVKGTIQAVQTETKPGSLLGTHLRLDTAAGLIDVHLGSATQMGVVAPLGLSAGETVEIVGSMDSSSAKPVLLARVVTANNRFLILRNRQGIPLATPGAMRGAVPQAAKGGRP